MVASLPTSRTLTFDRVSFLGNKINIKKANERSYLLLCNSGSMGNEIHTQKRQMALRDIVTFSLSSPVSYKCLRPDVYLII